MKLPREVRKHIEEIDEVLGFLRQSNIVLRQSNISAKNMARLKILSESSDEEVAYLAKTVTEVALVHPHKRRRLKVLARMHKDLVLRLEELGLWEVMQPY